MQTRQHVQYLGQPNPGAGLPLPITGVHRACDIVALFLADCTLASPAANVGAANLFAAFTDWAAFTNHPQLNQKAFSRAMKAKGYELRASRGFLWIGLYLSGRRDDPRPPEKLSASEITRIASISSRDRDLLIGLGEPFTMGTAKARLSTTKMSDETMSLWLDQLGFVRHRQIYREAVWYWPDYRSIERQRLDAADGIVR